MSFNKIKIKGSSFVSCKSGFYTVQDCLNGDHEYNFTKGINTLVGEIDAGVWAISYLLSMYKKHSKSFILFEPVNVDVDGQIIPLSEFLKYSCYMDTSYPLFSSQKTVKQLVSKGLKISKLKETPDDIRKLFYMTDFRFERPLNGVGNEIFKAMAAIGFCYGKEVFCFPWLSKKRFDGYHNHMNEVLSALESLNKVVVLPIGE